MEVVVFWVLVLGGKEGIFRVGSKKLIVFIDRDVVCKNKVEGYERGLYYKGFYIYMDMCEYIYVYVFMYK